MENLKTYTIEIDLLKNEVLKYIKYKEVSFQNIISKIDQSYENLPKEYQKRYEVFFNEIVSMLENDREDELLRDDFRYCLKRTSYSYYISSILSKRDFVNHTELADSLSIKKNHLTNIMKIIQTFKLVHSKKIGKSKYYYITPKGRNFLSYIENSETSKFLLKNV